MPVEHDSTFVINDVVLDIPPEQINIQSEASHKEWRPMRIRAPIKAKSGHSVISVHISVPFVGVDQINDKLRKLVAQFKLTPFCYVDNEHLRNTIVGGEVGEISQAERERIKSKNMALALQNLTVSTIPNEPCTLQADFYFVWFNYLPFSHDFSFKNHPTKSSSSNRPGRLWKIFYAPELRKLEPVSLTNSSIVLQTNEYLLTSPEEDAEIVDDISSLENLDTLADELGELIKVLHTLEASDVEDGVAFQDTSLGELAIIYSKLKSGEYEGYFNRGTFNHMVDVVDRAISAVQDSGGSNSPTLDRKLSLLLQKKEDILVKSAPAVGLWLEFPETQLAGENKLTAVQNKKIKDIPGQEAKLYFRAKEVRTNDELIAEQVSITLSHALAIIPMSGHQYPTIQYMGGMDIKLSTRMKCVGDLQLRQLSDFWNTHHNNILNNKHLPRQYNNVYCQNELLSFFGVEQVILESRNTDTIPTNPGTYDIALTLCESGIKPGQIEGLKSIPVGRHLARKMIWRKIFDLMVGAQPIRPVSDDEGTREFINNLIQYDPEKRENASASGPIEGYGFGVRDHVKEIFEEIYRRSGLHKGLLGSSSKESLLSQFDKIFAITDDEVYGIEGLQRLIWEEIKANREIFNQQDRPKISGSIDAYKKRPEVRKFAFPEQPAMKVAEDKGKALLEDIAIINQAIILLDRGAPLNNWKLRDPTTNEVLDLKELNKTVFDELILLSAEDITEIDLNKYNLSADASSRLVQSANSSELRNGVQYGLKSLLDKVRQLNSGQNPYKVTRDTANKYFRSWNEYALRNAEFILDTNYLNLPIFKDVQELVELTEAESLGQVYRDFPLPDIRDQLVQEFPFLDFEYDYTVEPDMYFYNYTSDNGIGNLVSEEDINEVKRVTRNYADNVYQENTTWFQQEYLGKLGEQGDGFRQFIENNTDQSQPFLSMSGDAPAKPSLKNYGPAKSFEPYPWHSLNNFGGIDEKGNISLVGSPGLYPRGESAEVIPDGLIPDQYDSAAAALGEDTPVFTAATEEVQEASDVWVHPLPGDTESLVMNSLPGFRRQFGRFHQGVDLQHRGGSPATWNKPVVASQTGKVVRIVRDPDGNSGGIRIAIASDFQGRTLIHWYMHLNGIVGNISRNSTVKRGQVIGFCGNTGLSQVGKNGTHLHFEVRERGRPDHRIYPFGSYRWDEISPRINNSNVDSFVTLEQIDLIPFADNNAHVVLVGPNVTGYEPSKGTIEAAIEHLSKDAVLNTGLRMNRAYPGITFSLIEEDAGDTVFRHDDFFSYSSIVSLDLVRDREVAADFCVLELTNISGILSNRKWAGTYLEDKAVANGRVQTEDPDSLLVDDAKENPLDSLMLREGIKCEIRLGYSDNPSNLEAVMVGRIVGVQFSDSDDLLRVEIQSLATELVQDLKGLGGDEKNGLFFSEGNTAPLLIDMISSPEVVSFGMWKRGTRVTNTNRDLLTDRFEWNPNPATDNIFAPDSSSLDPGSWADMRSFMGSGWGTAAGGILGFLAGGPVGAAAGIAAVKSGKALLDETVGNISGLTYFLWQTTIWDVFKEMELRHPEYISSPVPYYEQNRSTPRMTMFFGRPDFLYFTRDPSSSENARVRETARTLHNAAQRAAESELSVAKDELATVGFDDPENLQNFRLEQALLNPQNTNRQFTRINEKVAEERKDADKFIESFRQANALANGTIQPFRKYHVLTGRHHIVSNSIRVRSSDTYNAVTVRYTDGNDSDVKIDEDEGGLVITDSEQMTLKLDPTIPDEFIRENVTVFPNCYGPHLAKNYAASLLSKGVWRMYSGELVILGNASIKPYDICYIFDDYSDMYGPIQVRRVQHIMSNETGWLTVITPDCVNTISEGVTATTNQAMALAAEVMLKRFYRVAVGGDPGDLGFIQAGGSPADGVQVTPLGHLIGAPVGQLIGFFGGKRYLFRQQNSYPIRVQPLIHHGRPMVANFGPGHIMKNEFSIFDSGTWKPAIKGLVEQSEQWANAFKDGIVSPRGRWGNIKHMTRDLNSQTFGRRGED